MQNFAKPKFGSIGYETPNLSFILPGQRKFGTSISLRPPSRRPSPHSRAPALLPLGLEALLNLGFFAPPPQCFDDQCQNSKDTAYIASLVLPVLAFLGAGALAFRPKAPSSDSAVFDDPKTGVVFEAPQGIEPARDQKGELAFRAVSYTPWPVDAGAGGEAIRINVGIVGATEPRTFLFDKILPQPSKLVVVRLPRPLGIIFEEDRRTNRAVVAELVPGSHAEQRQRRAALDPGLAATAPQEGDVLRACTATNIVYPTGALMFGAQTPERAIVTFGADQQTWPKVAAALKRGLVADGDVTLVLERRIKSDEV